MQTLIEKLYEQRIGENGLYRMFSPDEIRIPARFPGIGVEGRIDCPGSKLPTEGIPLEVMLGYQASQSLYVMYSCGVSSGFDPRPMEPVTIGPWFEPLAGATLFYETPKQDYCIELSHKRNGIYEGTMTIHKETNDKLHVFMDGEAHLDIGLDKYKIERMDNENLFGGYKPIKDIGAYF
jgi:hypothetical protein